MLHLFGLELILNQGISPYMLAVLILPSRYPSNAYNMNFNLILTISICLITLIDYLLLGKWLQKHHPKIRNLPITIAVGLGAILAFSVAPTLLLPGMGLAAFFGLIKLQATKLKDGKPKFYKFLEISLQIIFLIFGLLWLMIIAPSW